MPVAKGDIYFSPAVGLVSSKPVSYEKGAAGKHFFKWGFRILSNF